MTDKNYIIDNIVKSAFPWHRSSEGSCDVYLELMVQNERKKVSDRLQKGEDIFIPKSSELNIGNILKNFNEIKNKKDVINDIKKYLNDKSNYMKVNKNDMDSLEYYGIVNMAKSHGSRQDIFTLGSDGYYRLSDSILREFKKFN